MTGRPAIDSGMGPEPRPYARAASKAEGYWRTAGLVIVLLAIVAFRGAGTHWLPIQVKTHALVLAFFGFGVALFGFAKQMRWRSNNPLDAFMKAERGPEGDS